MTIVITALADIHPILTPSPQYSDVSSIGPHRIDVHMYVYRQKILTKHFHDKYFTGSNYYAVSQGGRVTGSNKAAQDRPTVITDPGHTSYNFNYVSRIFGGKFSERTLNF